MMKVHQGRYRRCILYGCVVAATGLGTTKLSSAEIEHWNCSGVVLGLTKPVITRWIIVENRMFAANGKGELTIFSDTPTSLVAYAQLSSGRQPFSAYVYIIDKAGKKFVAYDDVDASLAVQLNYPPRPHFETGTCSPS